MAFLSARQLFKHEYRLLGLMIFSLLIAIAPGTDTDLARSFLVVHFGLFLLWQPVLKQEESFSFFNLVILITFLLAFIVWFNLWVGTFWIMLLLSLLTGRIFTRGLGRAVYGVGVVILFLEMILIITPNLFGVPGLDASLKTGLSLLLLGLSLSLLFTPSATGSLTQIDFIRGFMFVLLTLFLCMGSVLVTFTASKPYLQSLISTILIAALFLLATSILWAPRAGFSGLAQVWERYLLNIGGPFEQWISRLATLEADIRIDPEKFLQTCIQYLLERHWIMGVYSKTNTNEKLVGKQSKYEVTLTDNKLKLTLYAHNVIGPALLLHTKLLLSVLTFYYRAKLQEQQLIKQAHLHAIYETGSKLTHDVKNILQSTQTMTQIIQDDDTRTEDARDLLKKQLPLLTQRLKATLDKLSSPTNTESTSGPAQQWWEQLKNRYVGRDIHFDDEISMDCEIPIDIFDTVVENLLENARSKRVVEPPLEITTHFRCSKKVIQLSVCDNGSAIPETTSVRLFNEVVSSEDGLGIGLYQSAQQAENVGYTLELSENSLGHVCFSLSNKHPDRKSLDKNN